MTEINYGSLFSKYYDLINSDKDYSKEVAVLDKLIRTHFKKQTITLADVGCGTGNHSLQFHKRKYRVEGYDLSNHMIRIAKQKTDGVPFACKDFTYVRKRFDVIVSLFFVINSMDYWSLSRFFASIAKSMKKKSLFIFDTWNGSAVFRKPPEIRRKRVKKGALTIKRTVIPETDFLKQTSILTYDMTIYRDNKRVNRVKPALIMHFFTFREIFHALQDADLEIVHVFPFINVHRKVNIDDWKIYFVCKRKI